MTGSPILKLFNADCLELLRKARPDSIDALVTDPPAGISFMNKDWDGNKGSRNEWIGWLTEILKECRRVMKPGAHGLVWAIPRTSHWTATACEDAGFEVRDVVVHLFGQGFPKSLDISKAIDKAAGVPRVVVGSKLGQPGYSLADHGRTNEVYGDYHNPTAECAITAPATDDAKRWFGWGTALKPAAEHWILIRKPCSEPTVAKNVLKYGTGGINIDGCRIESGRDYHDLKVTQGGSDCGVPLAPRAPVPRLFQPAVGRFPANIVLDETAADLLDSQTGELSSGSRSVGVRQGIGYLGGSDPSGGPAVVGNSGGASRFFYVAKASTSEKNAGLDDMPAVPVDDGREIPADNAFQRGKTLRRNTHPTVKSLKLMEYLIRLITPPDGTVLDPFMGSGSTGIAARRLKFGFVGIEKEPEYFEIARRRIEHTNSEAA